MTEKQRIFTAERSTSDRMTYSKYLQLDQILSSQQVLSSSHDEMLFITIHQIQELWIKLTLHELKSAIQFIKAKKLLKALKVCARVSKIQMQMIQAWDVLSTLVTNEYLQFRDDLGQASGFQSYQYRLIEFTLGNKNREILKVFENDPEIYSVLERELNQPSIYDVSLQVLAQEGFEISKEVIERDWSQPYVRHASVELAWLDIYNSPEQYWELYQLAEKLVDIEDYFQQWRFCHMKTVARIIGHRPGTGGSQGLSYLKKVLDQCFFPELWSVRTKL